MDTIRRASNNIVANSVAGAVSSIPKSAIPKHRKNRFWQPIANAPVYGALSASSGSRAKPLPPGLKKAQQLPPLPATLLPAEANDVLELDEVWSFVLKKTNQRWLWTALCRRTRQIVTFVIGDRSDETDRRLREQIPKPTSHVRVTATCGRRIARCCPKKPITVLARIAAKRITWSDGTIRFASAMRATFERPCPFPSQVSITNWSRESSSSNTI